MSERRSKEERKALRAQAKVLWEGGVSYREVAETVGYSENTIAKWKKDDGWTREPLPLPKTHENQVHISTYEGGGSGETQTVTFDMPPDPDDDLPTVDPTVVIDQVDMLADLREELERERAERIRLQAVVDAELPYVDISDWLWTSTDDVIAFYGHERMVEMIERNMRQVNKRRVEEGLARIDIETDAQRDYYIQELADEMLKRRANSYTGGVTRTIKLFNPKGNNGQGSVIQVPVEDQVNNHAGSRGDAVFTYTSKGFKFLKPSLCNAIDCFEISAHTPSGEYAYQGYCSEPHMVACEANKGSGMERNPLLQANLNNVGGLVHSTMPA